jgi:single-stranded-DNA-specific exonuclease
MKLQVRDVPPRSVWALEQSGVHPVLARLLAARGVHDAQELKTELALLLPPADLPTTDPKDKLALRQK